MAGNTSMPSSLWAITRADLASSVSSASGTPFSSSVATPSTVVTFSAFLGGGRSGVNLNSTFRGRAITAAGGSRTTGVSRVRATPAMVRRSEFLLAWLRRVRTRQLQRG
jgi:hypothetical protein